MAIKRDAGAYHRKSRLPGIVADRLLNDYRPGEALFSQGDVADTVFHIRKGTVKVVVLSDQGKEAVVAILGAGDFCGEACVAGQPIRMGSAVVMTNSIVVRMKKADVIRMIHDDQEFANLFTMHLLARNIRAEADFVDQLSNTSEKRLARLLLILANFGTDTKPEPVIAKISQATLADMIGTTRSRVSFFMNRFRKLGFISYDGRIEVYSSLLNVILQDTQNNESNSLLPK